MTRSRLVAANRAWRTMRANHLAIQPECVVCRSIENLHVHHLRYRGKRGRSERPGDLVTLCKLHHAALHRALRPATTSVQGTLDFIERARLVEALL